MDLGSFNLQGLAIGFTVMVAIGGIAYVFLYPYLSGDARANERQKALSSNLPNVRVSAKSSTDDRRDKVTKALKDLDQKYETKKKVTLEMKIAQAGLEISNTKFIMISILTAAVGILFIYSFTLDIYIAGIGSFAVGIGLPLWVLHYLKNKRIDKFINEFPNAMDVIVRGIKSGLPLGDCLKIIANEAPEPIKSEFKNICDIQSMGVSVTDAVGKLYERLPIAEANFFGIVIAIQSKAGGNLSEALGNLSRVLRERKKMKGKVQAMSMEAKASAGIIASLPIVVMILLSISSPGYVSLLWTTDVGKVSMGGGFLMMMCGILMMKKMIHFDM